jgi:hypothetical protein
MSSDVTWLAVVVWIFIILFFLYAVVYLSNGVRLQDREFIEQRLVAKTNMLKSQRKTVLDDAFPRSYLFTRLQERYAAQDPVDMARLLEGNEYLEKVINNENPSGTFLPYYAPEQIRDELQKGYPGVPLGEALQQKLQQLSQA